MPVSPASSTRSIACPTPSRSTTSSPIAIPGPSHGGGPTFSFDGIANSPGNSSGSHQATPPTPPSPSVAHTQEHSAKMLSDAATNVLLTAAKVAVDDFSDLHAVLPRLARLMLCPMDHNHVEGQRVPTQLAKVLFLAINSRINSEQDAVTVATALLGQDYREIANRPQPRVPALLGLHPIRSASPLGNMCATLEEWLVKDEKLGPILRDTVKLLEVLLPDEIAIDFDRYLKRIREQPDHRKYPPSSILKRLDVHSPSVPDHARSAFPSDTCATDVCIETTKLIKMVETMVDTANLKYLPMLERWQQADAVMAARQAIETARLLAKKEETDKFVNQCIANSYIAGQLHLQRKTQRKENDRAAHAAQHAKNEQRAHYKRQRWMGATDVSTMIAGAVTVFSTPDNAPRASVVALGPGSAHHADTWSLRSFGSVSSLGSMFQQLDMRDREAALAGLPSLPSSTSLDRIIIDPKRVQRQTTLLSMRASKHDREGLWTAPIIPMHPIGTPSPPGPSGPPPRGPRPTEQALVRD